MEVLGTLVLDGRELAVVAMTEHEACETYRTHVRDCTAEARCTTNGLLCPLGGRLHTIWQQAAEMEARELAGAGPKPRRRGRRAA